MIDGRGAPRYPGYGGVQPPRDRSGVNGRICSSLVNLKGSLLRDDGQASIEWKAGIDGERTHFDLGFEQIPFSRGRPQSPGRPGGAERRLPFALPLVRLESRSRFKGVAKAHLVPRRGDRNDLNRPVPVQQNCLGRQIHRRADMTGNEQQQIATRRTRA